MSQINLNENNIIEGKNNQNIIFSGNFGNINIICSKDETVEDAIKKFCQRRNEKYNKYLFNKYIFLYNADKINLKKKIREYFDFTPNPRIVVHETNNLIGN